MTSPQASSLPLLIGRETDERLSAIHATGVGTLIL